MSNSTSETSLPTAVDVTPVKGRRVRTQDGSLLPHGHVLRSEPRSAYWLRLEHEGDVKLTPHVAEDAPADAPAPPVAGKKP